MNRSALIGICAGMLLPLPLVLLLGGLLQPRIAPSGLPL